jgi:hypothetical protein
MTITLRLPSRDIELHPEEMLALLNTHQRREPRRMGVVKLGPYACVQRSEGGTHVHGGRRATYEEPTT